MTLLLYCRSVQAALQGQSILCFVLRTLRWYGSTQHRKNKVSRGTLGVLLKRFLASPPFAREHYAISSLRPLPVFALTPRLRKESSVVFSTARRFYGHPGFSPLGIVGAWFRR